MFQGFSKQGSFNGFPEILFSGNEDTSRAYTIDGVCLWIDARDGLGLPDLSVINRINDRVENVSFVSTVSGQQPRIVHGDTAFNGNPVIECIDRNRRLILDSNNSIRFYKNMSFVTVASYVSPIAAFAERIFGQFNAQPGICLGGGPNSGYAGYGLDNIAYQGTTENPNPRIYIVTNQFVMINGVVEKTFTTPIGDLSNLQYNSFFFGRNSTEAFQGKLAEFLAFEISMTVEQALSLSDSLNLKYALY